MIGQKLTFWIIATLVSLGLSVQGFAYINMEFVEVWDPGNPQHMVIKKDDFSQGYGSVAYVFNIGKYETTNLQYAEFLNAVAGSDPNELYNPDMGTSVLGGIMRTGVDGSYTYSTRPYMDNKPVNFVSWYDSARFANWFHNGQPTGFQDASTTEEGAYTFSGPEIVSDRNPNALYFLPTEHEWDKAAFYEPGADTPLGDGWWKNPSHSQVFPTYATVDQFGNVTNPGPHTVNFRNEANWNGSIRGNVTTVGSAGNQSFFGAMDMTGNVFEWTMADPTKPDPNGWGPYTVRGGSYNNFGHVDIYERNLVHHDNHNVVRPDVGFRLASAYIEPIEIDPADFNGDGFVDGADLEVWQTAFDLESSTDADADGDGDSDGIDFLIWQRNYFPAPESGELTAVPEPSAALLILMGLVGLMDRSRRSGQ